MSPSPSFLSRSYERVLRDKSRGTLATGRTEALQECKGRLADLLGTAEEELVFVSNTTEGLNVVAQSFQWTPGDEVVISDLNFPSNAYPWVALRDQGVRVRVAESESGRLPTPAITDLVTDDTKLVSLPHVSMTTGYRLDLPELSRTLADRGVHLTLDGVQGLGCVRPDLDHVSAYASSLYKWLLGPFGMGILYVDEAFADRLTPRYVGYLSVATDRADDDGGVKSDGGAKSDGSAYRYADFRWKDGPGKLEYGHPNFPAIYCLNDALAFMEEIGWDRITDRVLSLSGYLHDRLDDLDDVSVVTDRDRRCGIVVFESSAHGSADLVSALAARNVHVSKRGPYVRAATHFYNNPADVDSLIAAIEAV